MSLTLGMHMITTGCSISGGPGNTYVNQRVPVAAVYTVVRAVDGGYISWKEHIIDDEVIGGVPIRGGDGLAVADIDRDGYPDVVSVHESDTEYDGVADGHIRIAFGTGDPDHWQLMTLAEGAEAGAAEDVAIGDINGDGHPDIIAACELAHLIYFENPGLSPRTEYWQRVIPPVANGRGSFIRVFLADLDRNGDVEAIAVNKGAQDPSAGPLQPKPVSWFEIKGRPLDGRNWIEHEFTRLYWPINGQPVDLDRDGDQDVVAGSVAEDRIVWFENMTATDGMEFRQHAINIDETITAGQSGPNSERQEKTVRVNGFNMDYADINGDGRLDIILFEVSRLLGSTLIWLEQPLQPDGVWLLHRIGDYTPDLLVGLVVADIDGDDDMDIMTGGYSMTPRDTEGDVTLENPMGRLAWFENPGTLSRPWIRHDISRRIRGMFDKFVPLDVDRDGDMDFISTRGNSGQYDSVFWLEQVRTSQPVPVFEQARNQDSQEMPLP